MLSVNNRPEVIRKTTPEYIKVVWECIRNIRIQKQTATLDKLIKAISRENNIDEESSKRLLMMVEADGLIERGDQQALKTIGSLNGSFSNNDFFNLPDFSTPFIKKGLKDWYCFMCHLPGELYSCTQCFRGYHLNCYKESIGHLPGRNMRHHNNQQHHIRGTTSANAKNPGASFTLDKFICPTCENRCENMKESFSRKQIRKLLDFATHFIRKKAVWKDMLTIGFRGEIGKNEYLVYRYSDLELIGRKIKDGRYSYLNELAEDAEIFVHDVCILHGTFSDKADQARVLLREIKDEINEVQLCADCYINAKAKLAEWITKPCDPPHKLIWARQFTNPGGGAQYFWPAKLLVEKTDGYEVRFFGGNHDRAFVKKHDTKSFHFRPDEIEVKHGSSFDRAWIEVKKLKEKIEQGYYTHSSGESDLPPTEDEYSDEIYLSERRSTGISITDSNLANGSNYSLFSSLSSRRSSALEKNRKSFLPTIVNGKGSHKKQSHANIISKPTKRSSSKSGGPLSKKMTANNNNEKSVSSYVRSEKSTSGRSSKKVTKTSQSESDTSDNSDHDSNNSSSVNMKSLNYKFSPKAPNIQTPNATVKSLRQNRKPSTKFSQLTSVRYLSLSDRIKMDLSSTESSEFDIKEERSNYVRKRPRKQEKYNTSPQNKPITATNKPKRSPTYSNTDLVFSKQEKNIYYPPSVKRSETSTSNEDTDRCCSPDHLSTSPLFRSGPNQKTGKITIASSKRGIAAADSTSNNVGFISVNQPMPATPSVSTTSPYPNSRQRINSGYNPLLNQTKRMVHKCIATTSPACNCQEKFNKQSEEERSKRQQEYSQALIDLENKLKHEFEEVKLIEINKVIEEVRTQMQEQIEKEKLTAQEALVVVENRHSEALVNTKRRQWCRNCLKEAIYHCCWNTSYCSIQCQQEHWQKEHKRVCRRKR